MALIKTGGGLTDIRGGFGGVYFTRDKSGLHQTSKPRRVHQQTTAQKTQRNAFSAARAVTKDPRWVSWLMYRLMNELPILYDAIITGDPGPDCTGKYELAGTHNNEDYYQREDLLFFIWWNGVDKWIISLGLNQVVPGSWFRPVKNIEGLYHFFGEYTSLVTVKLELRLPPVDYQIPKL